jgi:transcriptional regulator with XRE-family HTH domain
MHTQRTQRTFAEELPDLLRERDLSLRTLARMVGVGDDHLSRVLRGARSKRVTGDLASRVAEALGLPDDYFPETRQEFIASNLPRHPELRDWVYDELRNARDHSSSKPA